MTPYEQDIIRNVEHAGCHITMVFDPDSAEPSFAYSVGFPDSVSQPEIIVFGLPNNVMSFMINEMLRICRRGFQMRDGALVDGLLEGHTCVTRAVAPANIDRGHFNSAMWYRRQKGAELTEAFQIVWPGALDGLFPWDLGCAAVVRKAQPALYSSKLNA